MKWYVKFKEIPNSSREEVDGDTSWQAKIAFLEKFVPNYKSFQLVDLTKKLSAKTEAGLAKGSKPKLVEIKLGGKTK